MENDNNENIDSQNDTGLDTEQIDHSLDAEAKLAALEEQNKKLFARAKRAEGFTQLSDGSWVKKEKPQTIIKEESQKLNPLDILRDDAFKLYREGYEEEDIELILKNGGRKILEDKGNALTLGLQAKREQRLAEQAANQTNTSGGSSEVERKYTPEQLANMSRKELEAILPHA